MQRRQTVFVGLSGGVDSSVAALRLKKQGYNVVGVFIKVWHPEWMVCNWEQERLDAMRVAAHLEIPFLTCDAVTAYKQSVADYFITEYQAGRTPNPDVMCNQQVKFGAFLDFALENGADYIATGHYVQKKQVGEQTQLWRGVDNDKDQSYFLWTLTSDQLAHSLFPVGDTPKSKVRSEASAAGLPTAQKKDSQGICFLGQIDIKEFLSHYTDLEAGLVLDPTGAVIGHHDGAIVYTLGQRHGFTINPKNTDTTAHYVISRNLEANTITVASKPIKPSATTQTTLQSCNWLIEPIAEKLYEVQFRYRQTPFKARIEAKGSRTIIKPVEAIEKPAAGQSCVLYEGSVCLGGGIIE